MEGYGRFDQFRESARGDPERLRELAARLEHRARSRDEVAIRAAYLDLLDLRPGLRVLDVGCGTGVAVREAARRLAPGGLAVGLDPGRAFLARARTLAAEVAPGVRIRFCAGDARRLPFREGSFDVVLAVTALSHVAGGDHAVAELVRVVRPGGRVGVLDLDADSLILWHPDRTLTRRIVAAYADQAVTDGWLGRRLPALLRDAGLEAVQVRAFTPLETDPGGFYAGVACRAAEVALRAGAITPGEQARWLEALRAEAAAGRFLAGRTHVFAWGRRPPG